MPYGTLITLFTLFSLTEVVVSSPLFAQAGIQNDAVLERPYTAQIASDDHTKSFPSSPDEAAELGLRNVHQLRPGSSADAAYARALGFASVEEAGRAELGSPLSIHMINLFLLKDYTEKDRPDGLMDFTKDLRQLIYPLQIDGSVKSSLTVAEDRKTKRWQTIAWGSPKLILLLEKRKRPESNMVLLISPQNPLGLRFIGEQKEGELLLAPIADIPRLNLKTGQQISAHKLFMLLKQESNKYLQQPKQ